MMACREFIEAAPARVSGLLAANNLHEACTAVVWAVKKVPIFFCAHSLHGLHQTSRKYAQRKYARYREIFLDRIQDTEHVLKA